MSTKKSWLMGINESPVYVVREDARRWAVWTKDTQPPKGDRWGHFHTMRAAMHFARDVVDQRAFYSQVAPLMVVDPSHRQYAEGGVLPPGASIVVNGTGYDEPVRR